MTNRNSSYAIAPALLLVCVSAGCDRDDIRTYRAPKDATTIPVAASGQPPAAAAAPVVVWTMPEGWTEEPNEQAMRLATFRAGPGGVEVSLSAFPGDAGGDLANVNRWRGQLGMAPIDAQGLVETMRTDTVNGIVVSIVDLQSPDGARMLAAMLAPGDGKTWFVKANGAMAPVGEIVDSFTRFAHSIRLDAPADPHAGHNHPVDPAASQAAAGSVDQRLAAWALPSHWTHETGASPILSASYLADNGEGGARITVTRLSSGAGGDLANVNRWRGQLGLAPVQALDTSAGVIRKSPLVVDLAMPDGSNRMVAAIVPAGPSTYYFKMTGTTAGAGAEMDTFERLVSQVGLGETTP